MYEVFFGLKEKPFSLLPDPDFLFLSSKHALALSMLEYSLAGQAGFCVISGEIGSGKTTLIRALLRKIGRDISLGLISNTHSTHTDIAGWALTSFGHRPTGQTTADRYQELMHYLIGEYGAGRRCVLIVDEAQNLTIEALEELRLLSNINSGKDLLLQIILVGQPELLHKLKSPELCQFAQRISVSYHLASLGSEETYKYVQYRLQVAGAEKPIFTPMAIAGVHYFSGGVPRLINSICDMALVYAFADGKAEIDLDTIFRVVSDRQSSGVAALSQTVPADIATAVAEIAKLVSVSAERAAPKPAPSPAPSSAADSIPAARVEPVLRKEPKAAGRTTRADHADHARAAQHATLNGAARPAAPAKQQTGDRREPKLQKAPRRDGAAPVAQNEALGPDGLPRLVVTRNADGRLLKRQENGTGDRRTAADVPDREPAEKRGRIQLTEEDYRLAEKSDEAEAARLRSWFRRTFMRSS
jgi:type II secretory pathway predicted ATPase ExeA